MSRPIKLYQFGTGRSGTTLITQCLKSLGISVEAVHGFVTTFDNGVVGSYRDFRDIIVSRWRICLSENSNYNERCNEQMTQQEFEKECIYSESPFLEQIETANKMKKTYPDMLWLKYEEFYNDFDYIFDQLDTHYSMNITKVEKKYIREHSTMKANRKIADLFENFRQLDGVSGIHGHHIYKGEIGGWKKIIPEDCWDFMYEVIGKDLINWGYKL